MTLNDAEQLTIPVTSSLLDAVAAIDRGAQAVCCLANSDLSLAGVLTDGDVRRALLQGANLGDLAITYATTQPLTVSAGTARALVLDLMRSLRLSAIPEVDDQRRVLGIHTLTDLVGAPSRPNAAVVMAGGKGTRLGDLTATTPKPLMRVAGRPILEWIVLGLVGDGIKRIYLCVNHLATQIEAHFGNGERLGCRIDYLREDEGKPLGTAGGLTLFETPPIDPLIVMNGDLMVEFDAGRLVDRHVESGARVTLGTRRYTHTVPFGVVESDQWGAVTAIAEKPDVTLDINAAIYCLDPDVLDLLPFDRPSTMPELVQKCLDRGDLVATWPLQSDWIDVGTPMDLARAKGQL